MRSMTGFGQASLSTDVVEVEVQVKSVNGRYLDIKSRLPRDLLAIESQLHKSIRERLHRGRVDLWVEVRGREAGVARINLAQVESYLRASRELAVAGVEGELDLGTLLALPDVFDRRNDQELPPDAVNQAIGEALSQALDQVVRHREKEGLSLKQDLLGRLSALSGLTDQIEEGSGSIVDYQRQRLEDKVASVPTLGDVDQTRLAQEVAFIADKVDISEEITRLRSHSSRFQELLGSEEPTIGKNLDFLCQELNREINTVLAKSGRVEISEVAIAAKTEIERIREQVQNVE